MVQIFEDSSSIPLAVFSFSFSRNLLSSQVSPFYDYITKSWRNKCRALYFSNFILSEGIQRADKMQEIIQSHMSYKK